MAKGKSGRPRKPNELKIATGTYRKDRDGKNVDVPQSVGIPQRPETLNDDESWIWDQVVSDLTTRGVAKQIDTAMLVSMCELWGLYRKSMEAAKLMPTNKDARISVATYWSKWESAAACFGLNPSDRARLQINDDAKPKSIVSRVRA